MAVLSSSGMNVPAASLCFDTEYRFRPAMSQERGEALHLTGDGLVAAMPEEVQFT